MSTIATRLMGAAAEWLTNQLSPQIPVNEGIAAALMLQTALKGKGTETPPGSPDEGDAYIVGANPTGDWSAFTEDNIAYFHNGAWQEMTAIDQLRAYVNDGSGGTDVWEFDGADWQKILSGFPQTESFMVAASDESSDLTVGTGKVTFRVPYAFTLTEVRASVTTAPTGANLVVDINEGGTSILSTKLSIDNGEKTSTTAATPAVISDADLADDAEITVDIDQIGSSDAGVGLKVTLIGKQA